MHKLWFYAKYAYYDFIIIPANGIILLSELFNHFNIAITKRYFESENEIVKCCDLLSLKTVT